MLDGCLSSLPVVSGLLHVIAVHQVTDFFGMLHRYFAALSLRLVAADAVSLVQTRRACAGAGNGDVSLTLFSLCLSECLSLSLSLPPSVTSRTGHVMLSNVVICVTLTVTTLTEDVSNNCESSGPVGVSDGVTTLAKEHRKSGRT